MNFVDYLNKVTAYLHAYPNQRYGQACFNVLWDHNQDLAMEIHTTELDPFFEDKKVPAFLAKVCEVLDD